jgi:hypothetical protein
VRDEALPQLQHARRARALVLLLQLVHRHHARERRAVCDGGKKNVQSVLNSMHEETGIERLRRKGAVGRK